MREIDAISLIKAKHSEAEKLADICKRAFNTDRFYGAPTPECGPPGYDDPEFHKKLMGWVDYSKIIQSEEIVGGIIVQPVNRLHHILGQIFVDPDLQRKGIGSQAMRAVEKRYLSVKMWTLGTPSWNTRTKAFYEGLGYAQVGIEVTPNDEGIWYQKTMKLDDPYVMSKIDELHDGQSNVDVEGTITEASVPRNVKSRDREDLMAVNSVLSDGNGRIILVQWNEQIQQASVGDTVRIEKGVVKSFRGELQLSTGYTGRIIKLL